MIKLKKLLTEIDPDDNSDQWDYWYDYIYEIEYGIEKDELNKLYRKYNLSAEKYFDGKIVKLWDKKKVAYLEYDFKSETADLIKDINQWIYNLSDMDTVALGIDETKVYNPWIESNLKDARENPGKVYHYTTEEKWEEIQQDGQIIGSSGTGLSNRWEHGIFTSTDPEEHALGTYGDICLEIDLDKFKTESGLKELDLQFEPDVMEYLIREYIRSVLELGESRDEIDSSGGMSPYTIIVGHTIPLKYIRRID
jgi:hypothetical protein